MTDNVCNFFGRRNVKEISLTRVVMEQTTNETSLYMRYVRPVLRVLFVTANNIYCIPTYLVWMVLLLPLLYFNPFLFWMIEGKLFKWLLAMVAAWSWSAGYTIEEVGDDISSLHNQECLIVVNHQSTGDVPLLMGSFQNKGNVIPNMMWLMDRLFKYTNFGIVSYTHGDFFIKSGKDVRQVELDNLKRHIEEVYTRRRRKWLILFPEGGFLRKRKATSQKYAKANGLPHLDYVSLPRLGAMHTIIQTLNPVITNSDSYTSHYMNSCNATENQISETSNYANCNHAHHPLAETHSKKDESLKWVIDITVAYPNGEPLGLPTICTGKKPPCKILLHFRRYPIEVVPTELSEMTTWLYDRWVEKEEMLREFYSTGRFPELPSEHGRLLETPHSVVLDNTWLVLLHIFFIASTVFHYYMISSMVSLVW